MRTLAFNTGRTYTPNGQRVACALLDTGAIVFNDIDRGIFGTIHTPGLTLDDVLTLGWFKPQTILADYDANLYTDTMNQELRDQLRALAEAI